MRKYLILCVAITVCSLIAVLFFALKATDIKKDFTEVAFSFCAEEILSEKTANEKAELLNKYLTFTDLSENSKNTLIIAVRNESTEIKKVAEKMQYFEYSQKNMKELTDMIELCNTLETVKILDSNSAEELAEIMIKEIFSGIDFKEEAGDGSNFILRYYCSNVCIDVVNENTIRYLCNIDANSEEDLFYNWLLKNEKAVINKKEEVNGFVYKELSGTNIDAGILVDEKTQRVINAEIVLKYVN